MSASLHGHPYQLQSQSRAQADCTYPSQATSSRAGPSTQRPSPKPSQSPLPATSTSPAQSKSAHLGSELYDAIVQAADPKHPDHAAWQQRYGSLSDRSSRASVTSSHKRDKLPASSPTTTSSRNSFEYTDLLSRRKHAPRNAGCWDLAYRQANEAGGSDADDPPSNEGRYTPVRASFEGSVRSLYSASVASSSHRRRNRRLRDCPKPLVPPIPPPRVSSSTNWQSTCGSPSLPELTTPTPRLQTSRPSASGNTGDNLGQTDSPRMFASPSASPPLRMAHPYAFALSFERPPKHDLKSLPSLPDVPRPDHALREFAASEYERDRIPLQNSTSVSLSPSLHTRSMLDSPRPYASNHSATASKSMSKIRQLLGPETSTLGALSMPFQTPISARREFNAHEPTSDQVSAPAVPPKNNARSQHPATASTARQGTSASAKHAEEATFAKQGEDPARDVDTNIFPLRRDDEFRANEFESPDELEAEDPGVATQLPSTIFQFTPSSSTRLDRGPGVVRRSLDSIISPFRAGLLGVSSSTARAPAAAASTTSLAVPVQDTIAEGRRSFSDSRFVRPFLPRSRHATLGRQARPLSKVLDRPDDELEETWLPVGVRRGGNNPSGAPTVEAAVSQNMGAAEFNMPDAVASQHRQEDELPNMTSSRSLASMYSRSTSNLHYTPDSGHATTKVQQRPRTKLGGLFNKVKGSMTPKATSQEFFPYPPSPSASTLHQSPPGAAPSLPTSPPTSLGATSPSPVPAKKAERLFRLRVKSLTSLSSSRTKDEIVYVPPVPAIPASYVTSEGEVTRSVWEESPRVPESSTFSSEKSTRTIGRLLWRKKTQDDVDFASENFLPLPPRLSHPHIVEEAVPRSSMSSARGFDVVEPSETAPNVALTRTTIRKTLSPALLSDSPQPGFEAALEYGDDSLFGGGNAFSGQGQGRREEGSQLHLAGDGTVEEASEVVDDEQTFRSPLCRFIRGDSRADRLSRVEELSERLSYIADVNESSGIRPSASMPTSLSKGHSPRSFGEHRSARRNINGLQLGQTSPSALELADAKYSRTRKGSLDILRPSYKRAGATALESPASMPSSALTSPAFNKFATTPKSPAPSSWSEQLAPTWRSTASRNGRTSFSQDRDRAPVASPISPALPSSRGVGQAIKRLGIKGKASKGSKGIGPADVTVLSLNGDEDETEIIADTGSRPSVSAEPRSSFGGGARPSFSISMRSPFATSRPSFEATARSGLSANETAFEASGLIPSPVAPSFGSSKDFTKHLPNRIVTDGDGRSSGSQVAGLGIGSVQWSEAMPTHKGESVDMPGSASDGTFTTRGVHTPENGSLSHSYSSQLPARTDSTGATSPTADRASMDAGSQSIAPLKSAELLAFEDMLGRFPQQQKVLLQDISARVAQTPNGGASSSREDVSSFPPFASS